MSDSPLYIAVVWHMHQPFYRNLVTGETVMPWVRLHAVKDYLDMVKILQGFPYIHQTFNLVPSLIEQIEDMLDPGSKKDRSYELTLKKPADLTEQEKLFILRNFFMANWDTMIKRFPRYYDLLVKRGRHFSPEDALAAIKRFTPQDFTDLQLLFNLAWIDPVFREKDPQLKELAGKGKYFSEEDKKLVMKKQLGIMQEIIPTYKDMQEKGSIEVSVSPFFHPILPLLCDSDTAKISYPEIRLPKINFRHPEDAKAQLDMAVKFYTEKFGRPPRGMWPSEGSVSEQAADLIIDAGLKWAATDEEILFRSLGREKTQEALYRPYMLERKQGGLSLIFRDRALSDSIGFVYQSWSAENAAGDLLNRLRAIKGRLPKSKVPYLVPIILDGENAWEFYPNDGGDFLNCLYRNASNDPALKFVTVSEYLDEFPVQDKLNRLHPGSWINANFCIWIGHEEKNKAWEYLSETRSVLKDYEKQQPDPDTLRKAWKEIYIAEGSDWNWWYGDDNSSANDEEFDRLFRSHLANVYTLIGKEPPEYLSLPIRTKKAKIVREPYGFTKPVIDGMDTNYFEWINAGLIDTSKRGGTMHQSETIIKQIYFGFDSEALYLRFDIPPDRENENKEEYGLNLLFQEKGIKVSAPLLRNSKDPQYTISEKSKDGTWAEVKRDAAVAYDKILELAVKFNDIKAGPGDLLKLTVTVEAAGTVIERCPESGEIEITLPGPDYESQAWTV
ncbi:MAG: glycoside hydrolase family 57 protein [Candidatus Omnitrophica bacterium]|nr:glycoside hydrolase family 57 protein [Candidatus Omnitrophota bacterium]